MWKGCSHLLLRPRVFRKSPHALLMPRNSTRGNARVLPWLGLCKVASRSRRRHGVSRRAARLHHLPQSRAEHPTPTPPCPKHALDRPRLEEQRGVDAQRKVSGARQRRRNARSLARVLGRAPPSIFCLSPIADRAPSSMFPKRRRQRCSQSATRRRFHARGRTPPKHMSRA